MASPLVRRPPLIRVRSEPLCIEVPGDVDDAVRPPPTPLQRAISRLPSVRFSITDADMDHPDTPPSPSPTPRSPARLFSPRPGSPRRRLTIVIERRRLRTTIHIDFGIVVCVLLLLLLTTAAGMVVGARVPPSAAGIAGPRRSVAPLGWATPDRNGGQYIADVFGYGETASVTEVAASSASPSRWGRWPPARQIGLTMAEMTTSGVRARLGVARFCLGLEQSARRRLVELPGERLSWGLLTRASEGMCSLLFPVAFGEVSRWRKGREPHARRTLIEARDR